ncbi:MAG: FtsX-like permease family protein [Thermodesulfovibrionales bacterium]|jgi:putative ABC transport system permease protein
MNTLKIAARNILRNARRSSMTILAIAVGTMAMLIFGEFVSQIFVALETQNVTRSGHITVFRSGYFKYGSGNPAAYGIHDYQSVLGLIAKDPVLKPLINVVTPTINVFGIAGNFDAEASKTFFGLGVIPADFNRMHLWDEHQLKLASISGSEPLNESDDTRGFIGVGLGRILGLCEPLKIADCTKQQGGDQQMIQTPSGQSKRDFSALEETSDQSTSAPQRSTVPRLDLLAATAAGAPNVVNFYVDKAISQGVKEYDDSLVIMNFRLAQRLLYGRGEKQAVGIVLQLHRTEDIPIARARLDQLIKEKGLDLETRELTELQPFYKQAIGMFSAIFSFISAVMAVIVLFTIVNTMSMSVMERTHEIGTLRAMGVKKGGITAQFVLEGALLGLIGATLGLIVGSAVAQIINHAGLTWQPPGQAYSTPLKVLTRGVSHLMFGIWIGLGALSTIAAWVPANRAARMKIVDALGHV